MAIASCHTDPGCAEERWGRPLMAKSDGRTSGGCVGPVQLPGLVGVAGLLAGSQPNPVTIMGLRQAARQAEKRLRLAEKQKKFCCPPPAGDSSWPPLVS